MLWSSGQQDADEFVLDLNYARRQLFFFVYRNISARLGYSFSVLFLFTSLLKFD
jgi:hypothetical protein